MQLTWRTTQGHLLRCTGVAARPPRAITSLRLGFANAGPSLTVAHSKPIAAVMPFPSSVTGPASPPRLLLAAAVAEYTSVRVTTMDAPLGRDTDDSTPDVAG